MDSGPATTRASRRYLIQSRLARGGTGEAFRAIALGEGGGGEPVVVKRIIPIHAGRREMAELFLGQARSMSRLSHPNLVRVLDFGLGEGGNYYLIQEYVPGLDLRRLCRWLRAREEPLPVAAALHLAARALRGLAHAHTRGAAEGAPLVHRDVSPGNLLLTADGDVKVADFGVALAAREDVAGSAPSLDSLSAGRTLLMGTPDYMAPEQFDGELVDARADLFSVGAVLFEALTGERPFPGSTLSDRMDAARCGRAQPARELRPEIPVELEALLERALSPRPEDRFADAPAMAEAIEALLGDEGEAIEAREALAELVTSALREIGAGQASLRPPAEGSGEEDDLVGRELFCAEAGGVFTIGRDADEAAAEDSGMQAVLEALGVNGGEGAAADEGAGRLSAERLTSPGASGSGRPAAARRGSRRWSGVLALAAIAAVGAALAAGALGQGTEGAVMRAGMVAPRVRAAASAGAGAGAGAGTGAAAGAGAGTGAGTGAAAGAGAGTGAGTGAAAGAGTGTGAETGAGAGAETAPAGVRGSRAR